MSPAEELVERLIAVFGEPRTGNPDLYVSEFVRAIDGWEREILAKAGSEVIRDSVYWPKPAEVIERCRAIATAMEAHRRAVERQPPTPEWPVPSADAIARVNALVARMSRGMLENTTGDTPRPPVVANRNAFTGRVSPVFHTVWETETLAETIRKQDQERDE